MKNHFFYPYVGNKRNEVTNIYDVIKDKLDDIEYIVEPFCGSSALSYYIYLKNPEKKIKYILNDNDKYLIDLYNLSKDEDAYEKLNDELDEMLLNMNSKEDYEKIKSEKTLISNIFISSVYNIRRGLYPLRKYNINYFKKLKNIPILNFIRNADITFLNKDAISVYDEYKTHDKTLIFLDPPYMSTSGSTLYLSPTTNIYEKLYNENIKNENAYIVLCLENSWIIKLLFKDEKNIFYDKKYEMSKRKTEHIITVNR
jgi:site-specific DNA-adenine methylase